MREVTGQSVGKDALELRSYRAPWQKKGSLIVACRKCQRKLKGSPERLDKLRKGMKKCGKRAGMRLVVLNTPCLKVCPKGAVVVCTAAQLVRGEFSLVRSNADLVLLAQTVARSKKEKVTPPAADPAAHVQPAYRPM